MHLSLQDSSKETLAELSRLASIIESSDDAIISKDLNGTIRTWNRGASAVYGYAPEEVIGQSIKLLAGAGRADEEEAILARLREGLRVQHFETVRIRKNGVPIDVSLTISPILDEQNRVVGASHVSRDISERKRLEIATAQLAAIVQSSTDAIVSKDVTGIIQTWNAAAERLYGYSAMEVIGHNINCLQPSGMGREEEEILEKIRHGERVSDFETVRRRKDGSIVKVSLTVSPVLDRAGAVVGASHMARDITKRKEFEDQLQQTQRLESLGVLAGGIAHDFNNLLTGIIGNASLVSDSMSASDPAREWMRDLTTAAERAADLTAQMLAYAGKGRLVVGPVNVSSLVGEISSLLKASIRKAVAVHLDLAPDAPLIEADHSQMQQLVMNLIINGAEAIEENRSGTVLVRTGSQHLDENYIRAAFPALKLTPGDYAYIEVRDNGCGMDEETKARIFDPFFTTKFTGRGLGLAAALGIVNSHKGAIRVHSVPGEGTNFKVFLPASAQAPAQPGARGPSKLKGTVLVVDDEEIVRKVVKLTLENHGYRVLLTDNGQEAVDVFREMPQSIALIILDLTMPVMSGDEAFLHLRAIRADVPIILSSGYSETEVMRRCGVDGVAGFVQKPYSGSQLMQKVGVALARGSS